jgi:chromosome segregation ATPase
MARRPALDREEVFQAANTLKSEGKEVTAVALLDALGGGSLRTIYKHMEEWQKEQPQAAGNGQKTEVPEAVLAAFMSTWRTAAAEAAKETTAVRDKAAEEVKEAQKQFAGALEIIEKFETESEANAQQMESMSARIKELEAALHKEENEKAALSATAEQLRHQVKSQEGELERVHNEREKDRKHYQDEIAKLNDTLAKAKEAAGTDIERLGKELSDSQKALEKAQAEKEEAIKSRRQSEERAAQSQEKAEKAMTEAAELRGKVEALQSQNTEILSRLKDPNSEDKPKKK